MLESGVGGNACSPGVCAVPDAAEELHFASLLVMSNGEKLQGHWSRTVTSLYCGF